MKKLGIICKSGRRESVERLKTAVQWLKEKGIEVYADKETAGLLGCEGYERSDIPDRVEAIVVLGGDGTMLSVARLASEKEIPILGVNLGGLGFITEVQLPDMHAALERIVSGKYITEERLMLMATVYRNGEKVAEYNALNDVVINKGALARIIDMKTYIDSAYVTTFRADGMIVSSPTGSTAYCLSAGGPILYPTTNCIVLAPICPHTLTNRPIVLPDSVLIDITLMSSAEDVFLTLDGQTGFKLVQNDRVSIRKSLFKARLLLPYERDYFQVLRTKLGWGERTPKE